MAQWLLRSRRWRADFHNEHHPDRSLVLDMYDAGQKHFVWRAVASKAGSSPTKRQINIAQATQKLLKLRPGSGRGAANYFVRMNAGLSIWSPEHPDGDKSTTNFQKF